ncbi:prolipoprotein diacylglyceryl transferase [uncultured Mailhella sp.]|uniref:prolipoprotein diacylglyceryl transferase n=1 Tax=uncultured Mailhella sp. TaxID=1981031 RepID=UPI00261F9143|nr:prolipoprotein diacylglyceryl transferase [uncultured Mailhella sp.]
MQYPSIDPVALSIGPVQLHWYGLMYVFAFLAGWLLGRQRASRPWSSWTKEQVDDFVVWVMLGVILGARLGYVLFYDFSVYLRDPLEILRVWNGGMSFHGGLLGVVTASLIWGRRHGRGLVDILDFVAPLVPTGLFFGRIGNFINGELWGKVTELSLGMVFPGGGPLPRHPSQLYEAGLEGVCTFLILWIYSSKPRPRGAVAGLFGVLYAVSRIFVEFFRVPDAQLGYLLGGWLTMGQLLCLPLLAAGLWLLVRAHAQSHARDVWK